MKLTKTIQIFAFSCFIITGVMALMLVPVWAHPIVGILATIATACSLFFLIQGKANLEDFFVGLVLACIAAISVSVVLNFPTMLVLSVLALLLLISLHIANRKE